VSATITAGKPATITADKPATPTADKSWAEMGPQITQIGAD